MSDCPTGYIYYSCSNGWEGCCSINPCDPGSTCPAANQPDDMIFTSQLVPSTTADTPATTVILSAPPTPIILSSPSTTPSSTTTSSASTTPANTSTSTNPATSAVAAATATTASHSTSSAAASHTATSTPDSNSTAVGTIAGSVIGSVFALVLVIALLITLFLRRRRQQATRKSRATLPRGPNMTPYEGGEKDGPFAPYGGFYRGVDASSIHHVEPSPMYRATNLSTVSLPDPDAGAQMLDSRTVERHSFVAELEDTSIPRPPSIFTPYRPGSAPGAVQAAPPDVSRPGSAAGSLHMAPRIRSWHDLAPAWVDETRSLHQPSPLGTPRLHAQDTRSLHNPSPLGSPRLDPRKSTI